MTKRFMDNLSAAGGVGIRKVKIESTTDRMGNYIFSAPNEHL
jgi:hypothetical protein